MSKVVKLETRCCFGRLTDHRCPNAGKWRYNVTWRGASKELLSATYCDEHKSRDNSGVQQDGARRAQPPGVSHATRTRLLVPRR